MTTLLGVLTLIAVLFVIFNIARANELTKELRGDFDNTIKTSNKNAYLLVAFGILLFIGIVYSSYLFIPRMLPKAASYEGAKMDRLFMTTLFFTGVVFVVTQIILLAFSFMYRERKDAKAYFFPHSNMLEIIWTSIPAVVMAVLVAMGLKAWFEIFPTAGNEPKNATVIEVTAKQFNWTIRYPGADGLFGERKIDAEHISKTNELGILWDEKTAQDDFFVDTLVFVKDKPVIVKLNALDVLHSFYLPHFRVKMDCVPGIPTRFIFTPSVSTAEMREYLSTKPEWQHIDAATGQPRYATFNYELACAELCGKSHYAMQRYVMVVTQEEYDTWEASHPSYYNTVVNPKAEVKKVEEPAAPAVNDSTKVAEDAVAMK